MATLRLLNGDCLELMKDISANSIDLIICDLPYGCLGTNWDVKIDLKKFWEQTRRILRNDHSVVIHFCTTKFGAEIIASNPDWFRYDLVWSKGRGGSFLAANRMPMRSHEMIYVFAKKGAFYNRVDISGNFTAYKSFEREYEFDKNRHRGNNRTHKTVGNDGKTRCALSVIVQPISSRKGGHPTEKPTDLYRWLIERYSPADGTVLDPTFGSGNSVFAAHAMGRSAIGIEKDKTFYDAAVARQPAVPTRHENTIENP